jgi:hypothetical protein
VPCKLGAKYNPNDIIAVTIHNIKISARPYEDATLGTENHDDVNIFHQQFGPDQGTSGVLYILFPGKINAENVTSITFQNWDRSSNARMDLIHNLRDTDSAINTHSDEEDWDSDVEEGTNKNKN